METTMLEAALTQARRMTSDPEAESIAGEAVLHATRTYDPSKGLTREQWAAYVTRTRVWTYWRSQRSRRTEYKDDLEPLCEDQVDLLSLDPNDWQLLVERYIEGVAEWALARKYGVTLYAIRLRINAAKARFLEEVGA